MGHSNPVFSIKGSGLNWLVMVAALVGIIVMTRAIIAPLNEDPGFIIKLISFSPFILFFIGIIIFLIYRQSSKLQILDDGLKMSNIKYNYLIAWNNVKLIDLLFTGKPKIQSTGSFGSSNKLGSLKVTINTKYLKQYSLNFTNIDPKKIDTLAGYLSEKTKVSSQRTIINSKKFDKYSLTWTPNGDSL